jgi:RNA-directed DNA polymerase
MYFIEGELEGRFALTINRRKTRVVSLREPGASFDFLGYTFRYDRDLKGRGHRYLNCAPSQKSVVRERQAIREIVSPRVCFVPLPKLLKHLNRHLNGWGQYYSWGHPRAASREINRYVRECLIRHLQRRSQRRMRPPTDMSWYGFLAREGLVYL